MGEAAERAKERARKKREQMEKVDSGGFSPPLADMEERFLVFGPEGSGKSKMWLSIADRLHREDVDSRFYVLDTDAAAETSIARGYPHLRSMVDVNYEDDWEGINSTLADYVKAARPFQDWIVVDRGGFLWQAIQDWYIEQVYGKDPALYFTMVQQQIRAHQEMKEQEKKKGNEVKGGTGFEFGGLQGSDWQMINKMWYRSQRAWLLKSKAHKFVTTGYTKISSQEDDAQILAMYSGSRPEGQKRQGHDYHTILSARKSRKGWHVSTIREREGREELLNENVTDRTFDEFYLGEIAGWS